MLLSPVKRLFYCISGLKMMVFSWVMNKYLQQIFGQETKHLNVQKSFIRSRYLKKFRVQQRAQVQ